MTRTLLVIFRASVSKRGLIRTLMLVPRLAWRKASVYLSDIRFDLKYGVQTRGVVHHGRLEPRVAGALPYQPTPPLRFRKIIASLEINYGDFTFIDVGCGKGRALILATEFRFRRIVGIELSETLAHTARANVAAVVTRLERAPTIDVITGDAASFRFPSDPTVVFLFNPFLEETMNAVLQNLESSLREEPRDVFVVYMKPVLGSALDNAPFLTSVEKTPNHAVWRGRLLKEAT